MERRPVFGIPLPRRGSPSRVHTPERDHDPDSPQGNVHLDQAVVDCALYERGCRRETGPLPLDQAVEALETTDDGFVWIGVHDPSPEAVEAVGRRFHLHPLALEDAIHAHQRPKLEVHGETLFCVLKTARYVDSDELVAVGELMVFVGSNFVVTVRHGEASPLHGVREELEAHPTLLGIGPSAVFYAVCDKVVDDYAVVLDGLEVDISEIEEQVFGGDARENPAQRIYRLKREVIEFKRAMVPLDTPLQKLAEGRVPTLDPRSGEYFTDVRDHVLRDTERVHKIDELLTSALSANLTQLTIRDNQDMRKISAWVAIAAVPTMIFGLHGMNFEHMPELGWRYGYPAVLLVTLVICFALYKRFQRAGWL
jgi:magnesium transporter